MQSSLTTLKFYRDSLISDNFTVYDKQKIPIFSLDFGLENIILRMANTNQIMAGISANNTHKNNNEIIYIEQFTYSEAPSSYILSRVDSHSLKLTIRSNIKETIQYLIKSENNNFLIYQLNKDAAMIGLFQRKLFEDKEGTLHLDLELPLEDLSALIISISTTIYANRYYKINWMSSKESRDKYTFFYKNYLTPLLKMS